VGRPRKRGSGGGKTLPDQRWGPEGVMTTRNGVVCERKATSRGTSTISYFGLGGTGRKGEGKPTSFFQ